MAFVVLQSSKIFLRYPQLKQYAANLNVSTAIGLSDIEAAAKKKEVPQIRHDLALLNPEEAAHRRRLQGYITIKEPANISPVTGIPEEHIKERRVRIYEPPKNCMQSGTSNIGHWEMEFETRERWENPLMGWQSNSDPVSNMKVEFSSKEEAIVHCEKNGWKWFVQENPTKPMKPKSYGVNFSWNKRTRVTTK